MSCGIYKITNLINNHSYIGQSRNIEVRWKKHIYETSNPDYPQYYYTIHKAFRKYGVKNFSFEIIEECSEELLNEREIYWIAYYNTYNDGYNDTLGGECGPVLYGEDNPNAKLTEDDIRDIREAALRCESQIEYYQKYTDKISFRQFSRIWQGEGWSHILPEVKNFIQSQEYLHIIRSRAAKSQITERQKEIWQDIEKRKQQGEKRLEVYQLYEKEYSLSGFNKIWYRTKEGIKPLKKAVAKIDKNTNEILDIYESAAEAGKQNNCDASGISKVCRGTRTTCGNYKWRYYENE